MSDWTAGYMAAIDYTYGYYAELNPLRIKLALLKHGYVLPEIATGCELGFGQGLSVNIHAAASDVSWYGTDFNPSQAGFAQALASASGADARLFDESFAEFFSRHELPDFDYICLHGIWSWVSEENRALITDFIRRKLKVGGVVFASYNTQPGWSGMAPIRHLVAEHAKRMSGDGQGVTHKVDAAFAFAQQVLDSKPLYGVANPTVGKRFDTLKAQSKSYLAHEFFNANWSPMYFAEIAETLAKAKLDFAASAHYLDFIDEANLTPERHAFLKDIPDPVFRESVRDFMVNQQFRKDYWIKGARRLNELEQAELLRQQRVMLYRPVQDLAEALTFKGALGEAKMSEAICGPLLEALSDLQPRTLGELEQRLKPKKLNFGQLLQGIIYLSGTGRVAAVQDDAVIASARPRTERLNDHLLKKARCSDELAYLASPVIGGGVNIKRFHQLFLLAMRKGQQEAPAIAHYVWQILAMQGQKLAEGGKTIASAEGNIALLTRQAEEFLRERLPVYRALGII